MVTVMCSTEMLQSKGDEYQGAAPEASLSVMLGACCVFCCCMDPRKPWAMPYLEVAQILDA